MDEIAAVSIRIRHLLVIQLQERDMISHGLRNEICVSLSFHLPLALNLLYCANVLMHFHGYFPYIQVNYLSDVETYKSPASMVLIPIHVITTVWLPHKWDELTEMSGVTHSLFQSTSFNFFQVWFLNGILVE